MHSIVPDVRFAFAPRSANFRFPRCEAHGELAFIIEVTEPVVIKGNGQWPRRTAAVDTILALGAE